jgi:hypothetical protein
MGKTLPMSETCADPFYPSLLGIIIANIIGTLPIDRYGNIAECFQSLLGLQFKPLATRMVR